ncbi:putative [Escherichia phage Mu]|uniref:Bacteriophage Mu left end n=1 Tax=Escherichia phage Mu TaxID=2681603 RepID=Q38473_BPMU|nr:putative [Escherichia phage Mu]
MKKPPLNKLLLRAGFLPELSVVLSMISTTGITSVFHKCCNAGWKNIMQWQNYLNRPALWKRRR